MEVADEQSPRERSHGEVGFNQTFLVNDKALGINLKEGGDYTLTGLINNPTTGEKDNGLVMLIVAC